MMLVDLNEPDNMFKLIKQSIPVELDNLNMKHMSDIWFANYTGKSFQFSRKQTGELIGNIDEAEDQIKDYYDQADENFQIVEGLMLPFPLKGITVSEHTTDSVSTRSLGTKVYCYRVEPSGHIARGHSFSAITMAMYYVWKHRLAQCGVVTYETANYVETARLLVTIYRNEQKPPEEHSTLKRIIKPRITISKPDPFVKALMYLSQAYELDIGEVRAKALANRFANVFDLAIASTSDITDTEGIGRRIAEKLVVALRGEV
tara:strand:+ start:29474 stop:30253 length:780 start_codon:yes stop_codon:yes gene_type:complete